MQSKEDKAENARLKTEHLVKALRDLLNNAQPFEGGEPKAEDREALLGLLRVGALGTEVWLDLGRPDWSAVKATGEGWEIVQRPLVAFVRSGGMRALPVPVRGGHIDELRPFVNVRDEDFPIVVGIIMEALNPNGPYPTLGVGGVHGSAKTTLCKVIRRVVDPSRILLRPICRTEEDLMVAAKNNRMIGFDNVSYISETFADMICRLNTGIGLGKRAHYTNADEYQMEACREVLLNGIPEGLISRADLADRANVLRAPALRVKISEAELWMRFDAAHPRVLGALLDGLVVAIRDHQSIELDPDVRMIDYVQWSEAGCRGLGFARDEFQGAYLKNRRQAGAVILEDSVVARAIKLMIRAGEQFHGTMEGLLERLDYHVAGDQRIKKDKNWPTTGRALGERLRRIAPLLRNDGVVVEFDLRISHKDIDTDRGVFVRGGFPGWRPGDPVPRS